MVERLSIGSRAPLFTLSDDRNNRILKLDDKTLNNHHFILLYFYPQSNSVQPLEQFYNNHINSSLLINAYIWAILVEDSDDPLLIKHDVQLVEDEKKDNAYQFDIFIDRDAQVAWNYNVYNHDIKQGRQAIFIITSEQESTSGNTLPTIIHMQIVDSTKGKSTIDWKQVEAVIHNLNTKK
jgi:peroxiredoxin